MLEILLTLTILASISILAWPRIGTYVQGNAVNRFRYGVATLSSHVWRSAQLSGKTESLRFDPGIDHIFYEKENIRLYYPDGYRPLIVTEWIFPWNDRPSTVPVILVRGVDSLAIAFGGIRSEDSS